MLVQQLDLLHQTMYEIGLVLYNILLYLVLMQSKFVSFRDAALKQSFQTIRPTYSAPTSDHPVN